MERRRTRAIAVLASAALTMAMMMATAGAHGSGGPDDGIVQEVREGTAAFRNVHNAIAAGYGSAGSCVSGPDVGAMGIHYPNGALVADPTLDASHPEVLIYEQRRGRLRLVGVEFLVLAEDWHQTNMAPPVLMGQHFHYSGSPNRYGLPPYYQLHVWAWRHNERGTFANWNPAVSCADYEGE